MKRWYDQFKTGRRVMKPVVIANVNPPHHCEVEGDEYTAGLGDVIRCYVRHCRRPWGTRGAIWKADKADMERVLNGFNITW